jgi:hypothetical protein
MLEYNVVLRTADEQLCSISCSSDQGFDTWYESTMGTSNGEKNSQLYEIVAKGVTKEQVRDIIANGGSKAPIITAYAAPQIEMREDLDINDVLASLLSSLPRNAQGESIARRLGAMSSSYIVAFAEDNRFAWTSFQDKRDFQSWYGRQDQGRLLLLGEGISIDELVNLIACSEAIELRTDSTITSTYQR